MKTNTYVDSKRILTIMYYIFPMIFIGLCLSLGAKAEIKRDGSFDHDHEIWDGVLNDIVVIQGRKSQVNYQKLLQDPGKFNAYLAELSKVSRQEYDAFSQDQRLAFLINAYNAFQIRQVIENYPLDSIRDIGFLVYTPWHQKFFTLLGEERSLGYIEHDLVRKDFDEPRIHFALNCASISCPPLRKEAYTAEMLEQQLKAATLNFINDQKENRYSAKTNTLALSSIFKWYKKDWNEDLPSYLLKRMDSLQKENIDLKAIDFKNIELEYLDYNWGLNEYKAPN